MTLQGHPRSSILAPIESAYTNSYWSSIVSLVLSCPVSEILQLGFLLRRATLASHHCAGGSTTNLWAIDLSKTLDKLKVNHHALLNGLHSADMPLSNYSLTHSSLN